MASSTLPLPANIASPAYRADEVFKALHSNSGSVFRNAYQTALYEYLANGVVDKNIETAYQLYYISSCRSAMNALLLARSPVNDISDAIGETEEAILAYSTLFFDTSVFGNKLIAMAYIRLLPSSNQIEEFEKSLLISAIQLGPSYIYWKLGLKTSSPEDSSYIYKDVMIDSYWKFKELKTKNNQELTKEARAWVPAVLSAASNLSKDSTKADSSISESLQLKLISITNPISISEIKDSVKG